MEEDTRNNRLDRMREYFKKPRLPSPLRTEGKLMTPGQTPSSSFVESKIKIFLAIGTVIVILIVISQSAVVVQAGYRGVVLYLGAVEDRVLPEGFAFIIPFVEHVEQMEVRTLNYIAPATASSNDLQIVSTEVALNFHLDSSKVNEIYQTLGADYADRIIAPT